MSNQELVDRLGNTLTSDGWREVIRPNLEALRVGAIATLGVPGAVKQSQDGKVVVTDEFLKGKLDCLNWMLAWDSRLTQLAAEIEALQHQPPQDAAVGTPYAPQAGDSPIPAEGA